MLKKLSCFCWHAKLHRLEKKETLSLLVKWPSRETVFSNEFLGQNKLLQGLTLLSLSPLILQKNEHEQGWDVSIQQTCPIHPLVLGWARSGAASLPISGALSLAVT